MNRIVHVSIKVDDIERSTAFYTSAFGLTVLGTERKPGRTTRRLTDGTIDFTIMQYDSEDEPDATLSGEGPCIHHFGVEVGDRAEAIARIRAAGGEILSKPDAKAVKFRGPDGIVAEIVDPGTF
jgi:lactoylglutathione lyase